MAVSINFNKDSFVDSKGKVINAADSLDTISGDVSGALLNVPEDIPNRLLVIKHFGTLKRFPDKLNKWDSKMQLYLAKVENAEAGLSTAFVSAPTQSQESESQALMNELAARQNGKRDPDSPYADMTAGQIRNRINQLMRASTSSADLDESTWYGDIWDSAKELGKSAGDVVDEIFRGDLKGAVKEGIELYDQFQATKAVVDGKVTSGLLNIVEAVADTAAVIGNVVNTPVYAYMDAMGYVASVFTGVKHESLVKQSYENTMDFVARDLVGDAEKWFYEDTAVGRSINERSTLKYNSKGAEAIETGAQFAGETAICIATGGLTAGAFMAAKEFGEASEREYQKEDRSYVTIGTILAGVGGFGKGVMRANIGSRLLTMAGQGFATSIPEFLSTTAANWSNVGIKGVAKFAFWSKDALVDAASTALEQGYEAYEHYKETGEFDFWGTALSFAMEFFVGRATDVLVGGASGADWTQPVGKEFPGITKADLKKSSVLKKIFGSKQKSNPQSWQYELDMFKGTFPSKKIKDGTVFQVDENLFMFLPDNLGTQRTPPLDILNAFHDSFPQLKDSVHLINVRNCLNYDDSYWGKKYGIKDFTSAATGGNGVINIWGVGHRIGYDELSGIMTHESAHNYDFEFRKCFDERFSDTAAWQKAMDFDKSMYGYDSPSTYGAIEKVEDFAESLRAFQERPVWFEKNFPARYSIIKDRLGIGSDATLGQSLYSGKTFSDAFVLRTGANNASAIVAPSLFEQPTAFKFKMGSGVPESDLSISDGTYIDLKTLKKMVTTTLDDHIKTGTLDIKASKGIKGAHTKDAFYDLVTNINDEAGFERVKIIYDMDYVNPKTGKVDSSKRNVAYKVATYDILGDGRIKYRRDSNGDIVYSTTICEKSLIDVSRFSIAEMYDEAIHAFSHNFNGVRIENNGKGQLNYILEGVYKGIKYKGYLKNIDGVWKITSAFFVPK